jgi:predicted transcriptional regulator
VRKLKALAERLGRKESPLMREALDDLFRKYDVP